MSLNESTTPFHYLVDSAAHQQDHRSNMKYVWSFPSQWEDCLKPIDDFVMNLAQHFHPQHSCLSQRIPGLILRPLIRLITWTFAIETGFLTAVGLMAAGEDFLAMKLGVFAFVSAVVSQLPKRFIYRVRPYLADPARSLSGSRDKTSSFPSRGVLCAVVWSYFAANAILHLRGDSSAFTRSPNFAVTCGICLLGVTLGAFSRMSLGAHYFSDCVVGAVAGLLVLLLAVPMSLVLSPLSCVEASSCYSSTHPLTLANVTLAFERSWALGATAGLWTVAVVAISLPPVTFWAKNAYVFGTVLGCVLFKISFLSPTTAHPWSLPQRKTSLVGFAVGFAVSAALCVLSHVFKLADNRHVGEGEVVERRSLPGNIAVFGVVTAATWGVLAGCRLG